MKMHFTLFTFFMLLTVFGLQAQNKVISGKIIDTSDETMPGVTIIQKGTANGTVSDIDGRYSLSVPEGVTLVFSFIGYSSIEKAVGASNILDVTMQIDEAELDEVVVIELFHWVPW